MPVVASAGEIEQPPRKQLQRLLVDLAAPMVLERRVAILLELCDAAAALPPSLRGLASRLSELCNWEVAMIRGGRPERALRGIRCALPAVIRDAISAMDGDARACEAASAALSASVKSVSRQAAATNSVASLLTDVGEGPPQRHRPRPKNAWDAAGMVDTRESYPLPPPPRGLNGGLPGVY